MDGNALGSVLLGIAIASVALYFLLTKYNKDPDAESMQILLSVVAFIGVIMVAVGAVYLFK